MQAKENITRIFTRNGSLYYIKFDSFIIEQSYLNSKYKLIINIINKVSTRAKGILKKMVELALQT